MTKLAPARRRIRQLEKLVDWIEDWVFARSVELNARGSDTSDGEDFRNLRQLRNRIRRTPK